MREVRMKRVPIGSHRAGRRGTVRGCIGLISPANAQTFSSSYTSSAPKDCRTIGKPGDNGSTTQVCPANRGWWCDQRGRSAPNRLGRPNRIAASKEPAAEAWFAPFNSTAPTVEWRAVDGKPFAIIQRWLIADNNDLDKAGSPTSKPMLA
jgi:hypothetical protein